MLFISFYLHAIQKERRNVTKSHQKIPDISENRCSREPKDKPKQKADDLQSDHKL